MPPKINLADKLSSFAEHYVPKVVAELNGQYVKVVKFKGEYVWHHHAGEDEMFMVLSGEIAIHFRDEVVTLGEGELCVVPRAWSTSRSPSGRPTCCSSSRPPRETRGMWTTGTPLRRIGSNGFEDEKMRR